MSQPLATAQRAELEALLRTRLAQLDQQLADQLGGLSRAEHQFALRDADREAVREHAPELALDQLMADREMAEVGQLAAALCRLRQPGYGLCTDCGEGIAFARLKAEPWALRCTPCAALRESLRRP